MAKKSEGRWAYIAGIAALAILVVVALIWRGAGNDAADDAGDADAEAGEGDADGADSGDGGAEAGEAEASEEGGVAATDIEAGPAVPPDDPAECRAYCERLQQRGELSRGMTAESCAARLCQGGATEGEDGPGEPVPTVSEPQVPEMPDDCRAQCQGLQRRGELRAGMSLEQCYEALCGASEEEEGE